MGWPQVSLSEICLINPKLSRDVQLRDDTPVSFVPMAAIDEVDGRITSQQVRPYCEVKKGYTPFIENDVLFAKITPCMENGKAAVARDLVDGKGFGSTEFHVLRSGDEVLPDYLFYFLRQEAFRAEAKANFTGTAGQQRVPTAFLARSLIPLPPVPEQRRIVEILDRAAAIQRLRKAAEDKARKIIPALFVDMFGDPETNPKGWPTRPFEAIAQVDRGRSRHRPRDHAPLYGGAYPFIQTSEVAQSGGVIDCHSTTYSERGLAQSKLWPAGTLCVTIAANIAKTGILAYPACFPDSVVGVVAGPHTNNEYLQAWLGFLQPTLEAQAPQLAQKNINLEILRGLRVPMPPKAHQNRFAKMVDCIRAIRLQMEAGEKRAHEASVSLTSKLLSATRE